MNDRTKAGAFMAWLSDFAPAYACGNVPVGAESPYFAIEWAEGAFADGDVSVLVNLWAKTDSEAAPNAVVAEVSKSLGVGCKLIPCDGGAMLVKRGSPFAQAVEADGEWRRRYINLDIEFITSF